MGTTEEFHIRAKRQSNASVYVMVFSYLLVHNLSLFNLLDHFCESKFGIRVDFCRELKSFSVLL